MADNQSTLSTEEIREILKIFLDSELQDLRLEIGNVRLAVSKNGVASLPAQVSGLPPRPAEAVEMPASPAPIAPPAPARGNVALLTRDDLVAVVAPSIGVFYRRPAPDQPPFVDVGSEVAAEEPICLIEVMKMFTGVPAPCAGRIVEIVVADATMVEYGQPLMYIEPKA